MTRTLLVATSALALLAGCAHSPTSTAGPSPADGPRAAGTSPQGMRGGEAMRLNGRGPMEQAKGS
jgi:hypothetical protein